MTMDVTEEMAFAYFMIVLMSIIAILGKEWDDESILCSLAVTSIIIISFIYYIYISLIIMLPGDVMNDVITVIFYDLFLN